MNSAVRHFVLAGLIVVVIVGCVSAFGQTPSSQLKPSATETRKSVSVHVNATATKPRRHLKARTAAPQNVRQITPPEPTGRYYNCLELPQPDGCD
jgi:hypothetical protein